MIYGFKKYNRSTDKVDTIKTAIFTSHPDAGALNGNFPKLLTLIKETRNTYPHNDEIFKQFEHCIKDEILEFPPNDPMYHYDIQKLVEALYESNFYHHIAFIDTIYHIKRDFYGQIRLWKELCMNGIFDQWMWCAPFNRYINDSCRNKKFIPPGCSVDMSLKDEYMRCFVKEPMILLLRIYGINKIFSADTHIEHYRKFDHICNAEDYKNIYVGDPIIPDNEFKNYREKLEKTLNDLDMYRRPPDRINVSVR